MDSGVHGKRKSKGDKRAKRRYNVYKKGGGKRASKEILDDKIKNKKKK